MADISSGMVLHQLESLSSWIIEHLIMLGRQFFILTSLVLPIAAIHPLPKTDVSLLGPVYLPAVNGSFDIFDEAKKQALKEIHKLIETGDSKYGGMAIKDTSFSVQVYSAMNNETLFDFHFEAPNLNGSYTNGKLSDQTVYRTGSLGKLMAVYSMLVDIGDHIFNDPITKYVPELLEADQNKPKNPIWYTDWSEVTVGSLASQISGIGRDYHDGDLALNEMDNFSSEQAIEAGYPPLKNETVPQCSYYDYVLPLCSRKQFLDGMINHPPAFPSFTTPAYSNAAFTILGFAYENITGRPFAPAFEDLFQNKLGMRSTSALHPVPDVDAIIPYSDKIAVFSYSIGNEWPSGGQWTSTADLKLFGQAILQNSLLSRAATRRWMKPSTFTSQWASSVGAPWEIYRLPVPADHRLDTTRIVDLYTKGGNMGLYVTCFALDPDHQLGITVMGAGNYNTIDPVKSIVVEAFVNAAEKAAKEQARRSFTGVFQASDRNSSITLEVDEGPGVVIKQWISNGTDFIHSKLMDGVRDARLYPAQLTHEENGMTYHGFRAQYLPHRYATGPDLWPPGADAWYEVDFDLYNNIAIDAFVVGMDRDGIVQTIEPQALRVVLDRVHES